MDFNAHDNLKSHSQNPSLRQRGDASSASYSHADISLSGIPHAGAWGYFKLDCYLGDFVNLNILTNAILRLDLKHPRAPAWGIPERAENTECKPSDVVQLMDHEHRRLSRASIPMRNPSWLDLTLLKLADTLQPRRLNTVVFDFNVVAFEHFYLCCID